MLEEGVGRKAVLEHAVEKGLERILQGGADGRLGPERAVELALANRTLRDTPRSRKLLAKAVSKVQEASSIQRGAA